MVRTLGFDDQNEAAQFCQFFGLTTVDNCVTLDRGAFIDPEENWCPRRSALIEQKRNTSIGEVIMGYLCKPNMLKILCLLVIANAFRFPSVLTMFLFPRP